jgi:hypothetical protein
MNKNKGRIIPAWAAQVNAPQGGLEQAGLPVRFEILSKLNGLKRSCGIEWHSFFKVFDGFKSIQVHS